MQCKYRRLAFGFLTLFLIGVSTVRADEVRVAVAANFTGPIQKIAADFEKASGHQVRASYGATGMFYAQIKNGAPFDVLLAADDVAPARLEKEGLAMSGSRFTYAIGKLVLWSANEQIVDEHGDVLRHHAFDRIAIANPRTAPYGAAALQAMKSLGVYNAIAPKLIEGENITQAFQFAQTGNVPLAFVAMSQVFQDGSLKSGSAWIVPANLYSPIRQDAVLLEKGRSSSAARALLTYLETDRARAVIRSYGYAF